jgi:hypothetical protein
MDFAPKTEISLNYIIFDKAKFYSKVSDSAVFNRNTAKVGKIPKSEILCIQRVPLKHGSCTEF